MAAQRPEDTVQSDEEQILRLILAVAGSFGNMNLATRIARIYGERAQRIAASALSMYDEYVNQPMLESGAVLDTETSRRYSEEGRWLMDRAEELLMALYRRHFDSGLLSHWVQTSEALMARHGVLPTRPKKAPAIGSVDLSGFTKLTEEGGDEEGTRLASQLVVEADRAAAAHESHIIKLLGDGVMLHGDDPGRLIETALELVESLPVAGLPPAHAGVHAGPLIELDGDYFGRTVNVAARVADEESPGEVLVNESAVKGASGDMRLTEFPARELRSVREPIRIYRVGRH